MNSEFHQKFSNGLEDATEAILSDLSDYIKMKEKISLGQVNNLWKDNKCFQNSRSPSLSIWEQKWISLYC